MLSKVSEAVNISIIGFGVVFLTLVILAVSVKFMSLICKLAEKKGEKQI